MNTVVVAVALGTLVVVVIASLVAREVENRRTDRRQTEWFAHQERLMRAVLAKHAGEFGTMEQVAAMGEARVEQAKAASERTVERRPRPTSRDELEDRAAEQVGVNRRHQTPAQREAREDSGVTSTLAGMMANSDA